MTSVNNFIKTIGWHEWEMFDDEARARWTRRLRKVGLTINGVQEIMISAKPKAVVLHFDPETKHRHSVADCSSRPEPQPGDIGPTDTCVYLVPI